MSLFYKRAPCPACGGTKLQERKSFSEGGKISTFPCSWCDETGKDPDPENVTPRFSYFTVACGGMIAGAGIVNTIYIVLESL